MSTLLITFPFGAFLFLFMYWKRLKEDYGHAKIFSSGFYLIGGAALGVLFSEFVLKRVLKPTLIFNPAGLWFWGSVFGMFLAFLLAAYKFKMKFFETLEALVIGLMFWIFVILAVASIQDSSLPWLIYTIFLACLIFIFYVLDSQYKSFSWYRSGRVGFTGLAILAVFFLSRSIIALTNPSMISFIGKVDAIVSALISFICFLAIYDLSS